MNDKRVILEVKNLCKEYRINRKQGLKAVNDVSFEIYKGETFGIVGESGCGKTTCGKTCIGLLPKTSGQVLYKGVDIHQMTRRQYVEQTRNIQMIFQDPYTSLDPHLKVYDIIAEGIRIHKLAKTREEEKKQVTELMEAVKLPVSYLGRHVHELSGGQRQRIGIARALALKPEFLLCDEPISALDVSVQAQIINLMKKLQKERNLTMLFIAHDLAMVRYISDRIGVMYLGNLVEVGTADEVCFASGHPYSQMLLAAVPEPNPHVKKQENAIRIKEEAGEKTDKREGCRFYERCRYRMRKCQEVMPQLEEISPGHFVACLRKKEEESYGDNTAEKF